MEIGGTTICSELGREYGNRHDAQNDGIKLREGDKEIHQRREAE